MGQKGLARDDQQQHGVRRIQADEVSRGGLGRGVGGGGPAPCVFASTLLLFVVVVVVRLPAVCGSAALVSVLQSCRAMRARDRYGELRGVISHLGLEHSPVRQCLGPPAGPDVRHCLTLPPCSSCFVSGMQDSLYRRLPRLPHSICATCDRHMRTCTRSGRIIEPTGASTARFVWPGLDWNPLTGSLDHWNDRWAFKGPQCLDSCRYWGSAHTVGRYSKDSRDRRECAVGEVK